MNVLKVSIKRKVLFAIYLFSGISTIIVAQNNSSVQLSARFAHPEYTAADNSYSIDIEMQAEGSVQQLFGMNLRFFYDVTKLEFSSLSDLHSSYQMLGGPPMLFIGNALSGVELFNFEASAAYVNGGIQLVTDDTPLDIPPNQWTKIGTLNFTLPNNIADGARVCPSLIWDLQVDPTKGGFFTGDNGVVVTVVENDPATPEVSAPSNVSVVPFNWEYATINEKPYGQPKEGECFTFGVVSTHNGKFKDQGYVLNQNYPNPFFDDTIIQFTLPAAQKARLVFCDVTGKVVHTIQGNYNAGQHAVKIQRNSWPVQGKILFYRLETDNYTSNVLKMTILSQ